MKNLMKQSDLYKDLQSLENWLGGIKLPSTQIKPVESKPSPVVGHSVSWCDKGESLLQWGMVVLLVCIGPFGWFLLVMMAIRGE